MHSTADGLSFYICSLNKEVADEIVIGSRDFKFLCGDGQDQYLLVLVRGGKILRGEPKPYGDLENTDVIEVSEIMLQHEARLRAVRESQ